MRSNFQEYPDLCLINENEISLLGMIQDRLAAVKTAMERHSLLCAKILIYLSLSVKALTILHGRFYRSKALKRQIDYFDIYFSPGYLAPGIVRDNKKVKRFTLIYDTIPLLFPNLSPFMKYFGYSWTKTLVDHLDSDDYCFSISKQSKKDFLAYCPDLIHEQILVTPLAASENFYCCTDVNKLKAVKEKYHIPSNKKYIFSLCTLEPRKNLLMSVRSFIKFVITNEIDDLVFVIGGGSHDRFVGILEKEIRSFEKYQDKIIKVGYVDDEDLAPLYSNSEFFVYPSLYEGFGLPPLEAMQCGCPVITSNTSSLPEVVGDAGIMVDPNSEEEITAAMKKLYFDEALRKNLSEKGLARAQKFSWEKSVGLMVDEFRTVIELSEK